MVDIFETHVMLGAVRQDRDPVGTFLLDHFFPVGETAGGKNVIIDIVRGDQRLAPFVAPTREGKIVEKEATQTNIVEPAYIKPKMATQAAAEFKNRTAGEIPGLPDPLTRAQERLTSDIIALEAQINRREEWMAAQALVTGQIPVVGEGVNRIIDMGMRTTHKITLSGTDRWSDPASDQISDIGEWNDLVALDGQTSADTLILGTDAAAAFINNPTVQKLLGNRGMNVGRIEPINEVKQRPGATYLGTITITGVGVDVYRYSTMYRDETGAHPLVPASAAVLTSTLADFRRHYGAIQDYAANFVPVPIFPKSWVPDDPSTRFLLLQSAPVPAPHQIDAVVSAIVL